MSRRYDGEMRRRIHATIAFFSEAVRFVIIPLILLELIMGNFPLITPAMASRIARNLIIFGGLTALFSSLEAYFPRGSWLKMFFGILSIATLCTWFWAIFEGREISFSYGPVFIEIDVVDLVLLIIIAISLKGMLHVLKFLIASREQRAREEAEERKRREEVPYIPITGPVVLPDNEVHEPEFLHWYSKPEPPPPESDTVSCPICFKELNPNVKICPDCGAWLRSASRAY